MTAKTDKGNSNDRYSGYARMTNKKAIIWVVLYGTAEAVPFRSCLNVRLRRFCYKSEKQIPPLRCGMANKKYKSKLQRFWSFAPE